jgi:hypothetical protein
VSLFFIDQTNYVLTFTPILLHNLLLSLIVVHFVIRTVELSLVQLVHGSNTTKTVHFNCIYICLERGSTRRWRLYTVRYKAVSVTGYALYVWLIPLEDPKGNNSFITSDSEDG